MTAVAAAPYVALLAGSAAVLVSSTGLDEGSGPAAGADRPDMVWVAEDRGEAVVLATDHPMEFASGEAPEAPQVADVSLLVTDGVVMPDGDRRISQADAGQTTPSPSATPHITEDVVRELEGVRVTLLAMAGIAVVGAAGWLFWARTRRLRARRRQARGHSQGSATP